MLGKGISRLSNWPRIIFKFEKTCRNLQGVYSNTAIVRFKADFRESNDNENKIPGGISSRYEPFTEETVPIFDVEEERQKVDKPLAEKLEQFEGINLQSKKRK